MHLETEHLHHLLVVAAVAAVHCYEAYLTSSWADVVAAVAAGRKHGVVGAGHPVHGFHFDSSPADDKHSVSAPTAAGKSVYILCIYSCIYSCI